MHPDHNSPQLDDYFRRARRWYDLRYHFPILERSFLLLFGVLTVLSMLLGVMTWLSLYPLAQETPFYIVIDRVDDRRIEMQKLRRGEEPVMQSVARYLVSNYVVTRERYGADAGGLTHQNAIINGQTAPSGYARFVAEYRPENPRSRLRLYGEQGSVRPEVLSIDLDLDRDEGAPYLATVRFARNIYRQQSAIRTFHIATIEFSMPELTIEEGSTEVMMREDGQLLPLGETIPFQVLSYEVRSRKDEETE